MTLEAFFSDYANSITDTHGDTSELLEICQGMLSGFTFEVCEIDAGAHYTLEVRQHTDREWNMESDFSDLRDEGRGMATLYRFETLAAAQGALARFLSAAL